MGWLYNPSASLKQCVSLVVMDKNATAETGSHGDSAWHVIEDFLAPLYVAYAGVYTIYTSARIQCNTAAKAFKVTVDSKEITGLTSGNGEYAVQTGSLATQSLTAGWKTVTISAQADGTSRVYSVQGLYVALMRE